MAAEYDLRERPNPGSDDEPQPLYPRIVVKRTIKTRELAEIIHEGSTFGVGEIEGLIGTLVDRLTNFISDGYSVEIEGLGFFTASLKARPVMNKSEIRAYSVQFDSVNFRPSSELKRNLKGKPLVRARYGFRQSEKLPVEERRALVENYLDEHHFITRKQYSRLTGLLQGMALTDLNGWVEEGWLTYEGVRSTKIFLRAPSDDTNVSQI